MCPHAGEAGGLIGTEPLDVQAARSASRNEAGDARVAVFVWLIDHRELQRTGDELLFRVARGQPDMCDAADGIRQPAVALVPALAALAKHGTELRARQCGGQVAHAQAEVGRAQLPAVKGRIAGPRQVRAVQHVAARQQDRLRGQVFVVAHQQAAFARIGMLVALQAEASSAAPAAGRPAVPASAHRVRTVFDQLHFVASTQHHQPLHVADMAAHMRQQQRARTAGHDLAFKVSQVDQVVVGHVHQHRLGLRMRDGAGHGGQRKAVGQHPVAGLHTGGLECDEHRRATGVHRHAVARADLLRKGLFQQRDLARLAAGLAIAV